MPKKTVKVQRFIVRCFGKIIMGLNKPRKEHKCGYEVGKATGTVLAAQGKEGK